MPENPHSQFNALQKHVYHLMTRELSPGLAYHGIHHTRDQVVPAVQQLCKTMTVDPGQERLIVTAALLHDIGFIKQYQDNEEIGAELAAAILPDFGYNGADIDTIGTCILATSIPQRATNTGEQILCDADMVTLGQDIFLETSMMLRREIATFLQPITLRTWIRLQYDFLCSHRYYTSAAQKLLNSGKEQNKAELEQLLPILPSDHH